MATLRVQFHKAGQIGANGAVVPVAGPAVSAGELTIEATKTAGGSQLSAPTSGGPHVVRLSAVGDQCYVAFGSGTGDADADTEPRVWLASGGSIEIAVAPGQKIGCKQATIS